MPATSFFQNSKLWQLMVKLPPSYLREADRWVYSPFFNRKVQVNKLWKYLLEVSADANLKPDFKTAYSFAFPNEAYDLPKLRLAMSDLYKLLLSFLAYKEWNKEKAAQALYQAKALRYLGLDKLSLQQLKQAEQISEKEALRNADYFRIRQEIMIENYFLGIRSQPADARQLQALSDLTDLSILSAKLRQTCLTFTHQSVYPADYQMGFTQQAITYIETHEMMQIPAIGLYYYCYLMLKQPEQEQYFHQFKALLFAHGSTFTEIETRDLYLMGINYCIRQVNQEKQDYFIEIIQLYRQGLEGEHLMQNGVLSRFTYYNIVAAGLRTGDYEWVEKCIYKYRKKLHRTYRESSFSFCLARLEYARRHYDIALSLLQKANYRDPLLHLAAKTVLLKIYYETDEYDLLESNLDAMHNYIRRKKVIGYHRTNYLNIIRYTRKLMAVNPYDKQAVRSWQQQLQSEEILTERQWLSEQLA